MSIKSSKSEDRAITCLAWLITFGIAIIMAIIQGWVLTVLWDWFVVPTFNVSQLSIAVAIGISIIVSMFRGGYTTNKEQTLEQKIGVVVGIILSPFLSLLLGWIVHMFM